MIGWFCEVLGVFFMIMEKIDQIALEANFLVEDDPLSLPGFRQILCDASAELEPRNMPLFSLFNAVAGLVKDISEHMAPFSQLESLLPELVNFFHLNEYLWDASKKKIELTPELMATVAQLTSSFEVRGTTAVSEPVENSPEPAGSEFENDEQLFRDFIAEARDHLLMIEESILGLEADATNSRFIDSIFRAFHTIKGVSLFLKLKHIAELSHRTENVLEKIRSKGMPLSSQDADVLLCVRDQLMIMIDRVESNLAKKIFQEEASDIHALLDQVEDMLQRIEHGGAGSSDKISLPKKQETHAREASESSIKIDAGKVDNLINYTGELLIAQSQLWNDPYMMQNGNQKFINVIDQVKRISTELQKISLSMRMVQIKPTFTKMQRIARDVAKQTGKPIRLMLVGEETELDRSLIDLIHDPLVHMVRNSIDSKGKSCFEYSIMIACPMMAARSTP
ncbi:Hpt domain-containing protein [Candidatus Magnetaquicoccus inordinatus]|uniref:Hpt domain-containing protein n=1 Tax=Candidatus Magnetaquicoccus inordinatus TaxID=2496818 RepID=UPI0012913277|nr:Hpt domain-containing protein [Candidatus Magnetaquicoccus inordinatus]